MSIHLGSVLTYPCSIIYIVSKRDQTNAIHLSGIQSGSFDCTQIPRSSLPDTVEVKEPRVVQLTAHSNGRNKV